MKKVKVIKPFYQAKGKELYVDDDRYDELIKLELVEEVKTKAVKKEKASLSSKTKSIEKAIK